MGMDTHAFTPLDTIGYYQVTERRAQQAAQGWPPLTCGDLLLTARCNYQCRYCNGLHLPGLPGTPSATGAPGAPAAPSDMPFEVASATLAAWMAEGLRYVRFSGGEPTVYRGLRECVRLCQAGGVARIALSTNGSLPLRAYEALLHDGVSELAISVDAARPALADDLAGRPGQWARTVANLRALAPQTYVIANIVLTAANATATAETVRFVHALGVADIKLMTDTHCAHQPRALEVLGQLEPELLAAHPLLRYRVRRLLAGRDVRGLGPGDSPRCHLVKDDSAVAGRWHFPCAIYARECGAPIGPVGPRMRAQRQRWFEQHQALQDPICRRACPDFMADYNRRCEALAQISEGVECTRAFLREGEPAAPLAG